MNVCLYWKYGPDRSKKQVWHTDEAELYYYEFKTSAITILEPFGRDSRR